MNKREELAYLCGQKSAYRRLLSLAVAELEDATPAIHWKLEREAAIAILREVCGDFGDNDWKDTLCLRDIIEKHLARHLWANQSIPPDC